MAPLDLLAIIRAPLEQYPPSVNQVALLAEAGLKVGVVDLTHADYPLVSFKGAYLVERVTGGPHVLLYKEKRLNPLARLVRVWKFRRCVQRTITQLRPKVVLAYDPNAIWAVGRTKSKETGSRLIWHFHELFLTPVKGSGFGTARTVRFATENAAGPDLVLFPDHGRSEMFARTLTLATVPTVVINCPRKMGKSPEDHLTANLAEQRMAGRPAVYFHGWVGPSRCLETIIQSMRWWPENAVFVIVGPVAQSYRESLLALGAQVGGANRLLFLGGVPYAEVLHLAAGAAVGGSLVADQNDLNWTYSAGAINKRFEYMAVGLPQVANRGPGMAEIIEQPDCGFLVDPTSPEEVGRALARLLDDSTLRRRMSENARKAHLSNFNYEYQFAAVLNQILGWCGKVTPGSDAA